MKQLELTTEQLAIIRSLLLSGSQNWTLLINTNYYGDFRSLDNQTSCLHLNAEIKEIINIVDFAAVS